MSDTDLTFFMKFKKSDIFTPDNISELMASKLSSSGTLLEPAVGTGNLLKYINTNNYNLIDIFDIKKEYIDQIPEQKNINKHICDFLLTDCKRKYNNIILNPPYIKIQDLPKNYVSILKQKWPIFKTGNIDLYYIFMIKCIELLEDNGKMVCITPNSYLHNKSALKFREYLFNNKLIYEIIDFKDKKVFTDVAVYCCITVITKQNKKNIIYTVSNTSKQISYETICNVNNSMYLLHYEQSFNNKLSDICRIYNGIATLRDSIYIHEKKLFDEPCWKKIITPYKYKYCIYPYTNNGIIINEDIFKKDNPQTYEYLLTQKDELAKRDNGRIKYPQWYAYGRTQSLVISKKEKVIYISTFIDPKNLKFKIEKPELHISSLCIEPKDINDIDKIINIITNNIDYIKNNSNVKNNGWINISSTLLKNIPIQID
jgi:adenine-specific DNA-methyltransferase